MRHIYLHHVTAGGKGVRLNLFTCDVTSGLEVTEPAAVCLHHVTDVTGSPSANLTVETRLRTDITSA